jgi:hypothetical protein
VALTAYSAACRTAAFARPFFAPFAPAPSPARTIGRLAKTSRRKRPCVARLARRDVLRRALGHDAAAAVAAFGAHVDDPIGRLDDLEVVLDDDDRVAGRDQLLQQFEQLGDVVEVEAGGRLVQNVEGAAGGALG